MNDRGGNSASRSERGLAAHVRAGSRLGRARITPPANSLLSVRPDELERRLQERLDALGPAPRAELLHVIMLPDFDADRIGEYWGYPQSRASPSCSSTARRIGRSERCWSGCCGRTSGAAAAEGQDSIGSRCGQHERSGRGTHAFGRL